MCVGAFACQSRSSATVCVCPVVVQCYCSMEPTPTSATPTASLPWTWLNPPPRPSSQVSFLSVLSVKCHTHTHAGQHMSVFLCVLLFIACSLLQIACVCLYLSCFLVCIHCSLAAGGNTFFFPPRQSITLLFCKAVPLMHSLRLLFSLRVQGLTHIGPRIVFILLSARGQKCLCLCFLICFL